MPEPESVADSASVTAVVFVYVAALFIEIVPVGGVVSGAALNVSEQSSKFAILFVALPLLGFST
jgi:hypothetical protein